MKHVSAYTSKAYKSIPTQNLRFQKCYNCQKKFLRLGWNNSLILTYLVDTISSSHLDLLCQISTFDITENLLHFVFRSSRLEMFCKKGFCENTCAWASFLVKLQAQVCNFIKKETLAQVFSCEIFEISNNTFY